MVLRGDLDLASFQILHGLVATTVTEFQLERLATECEAENLVPQTDSEGGHAGLDDVTHRLGRIRERRGIARAIRKEYARGFVLESFRGWGSGRDDLDL